MKTSTSILLALALLLAPSAASPTPPSPPYAEHFASPAIGISIDPPKGWRTLERREVAPESKNRLPDVQILAALRPLEGRPLVEFAKHPEPYPELNPTIQLNVQPLGGLTGKKLDQMMTRIMLPLRNAHPDFHLIGPMKDGTVSRLKSLEAIAAYTLTVGPRQYDVRSRIWVAPRGALLFVIAMTDPPKGGDVAEREFEAALASIQIEP
jgi:hypothetical protein